ncbi:MAG: DUF998 domain-containing protein [bacterium]|nr:DUF998 domain-containing protein [bacterium]
MNLSTRRINIFIYVIFFIVSTFLPLISFQGYSIITNTTSHLGAQGSPYAWVMNLTFILLGLTSLRIFIKTNIRFHQVIGSIFSISLLLTGIFRHSALIEGYSSIIIEDTLHSIFATTTGTSFVLLAFGHGFISSSKQRISGLLLAGIATVLSLTMMFFPLYMGLFQRIMIFSSFGWIFFYMKPPMDKQFTQ